MADETMVYLADEDGGELAFRKLDTIDFRGETYVVLEEVSEEETEDEDDGNVMIARVDGDEFDFDLEEDILDEVFDLFRIAWDEYEFGPAE